MWLHSLGMVTTGLERVARYPSTYLLYVVDIEIYLSCSILEGIRDPGTESTLDHSVQDVNHWNYGTQFAR